MMLLNANPICQECHTEHTAFHLPTGHERYIIVDLATQGEAFFNCRKQMLEMAAIMSYKWKHPYRIEDRIKS
jgi:hypothetical protein